MNKTLILIPVLALVAACGPAAQPTVFEVLPDELKDCKFFYIRNSSGQTLNVVRCPNSNTTAKTSGKHPVTTVTIDGVDYELTPKKKEGAE